MSCHRLFKVFAAPCSALVVFILMLPGCAGFPASPAETAVLAASPPVQEATFSPLVAWAAVQSPDRFADAILDDPEFGRNVSVRVDSYYLSAMGLPCRRVRVNVVVNGPPAETVAVCQDADSRWFLAPRIWKSAAAGNHR